MAGSSFGTQLKRGDGGSPTETFTKVAEVQDIQGPDFKLNTEDMTSHDSTDGWEEIIPTTLSAGSVKFAINYAPAATTHSATAGLLYDLVNRVKRNFQIVFPDTGSTTWSFSAYVTGFSTKEPVKGKMTADITLDVTGKPTLE